MKQIQFFEKIFKKGKYLARMTKQKEKRCTFTNINITVDPADIKSLREYYKQFYAHKFNSLEEMDQLEKHDLNLSNRK